MYFSFFCYSCSKIVSGLQTLLFSVRKKTLKHVSDCFPGHITMYWSLKVMLLRNLNSDLESQT